MLSASLLSPRQTGLGAGVPAPRATPHAHRALSPTKGSARGEGDPGTGRPLELHSMLLSSSEALQRAESTRDFLKRIFHCDEVHSKRKKNVFISRKQQLTDLCHRAPGPMSPAQFLITEDET